MKQYRCYFLTADDRIGSHRDFEAWNDAEAITKGRAYYTEQRLWDGFELWRDRRCVYADRHGHILIRRA